MTTRRLHNIVPRPGRRPVGRADDSGAYVVRLSRAPRRRGFRWNRVLNVRGRVRPRQMKPRGTRPATRRRSRVRRASQRRRWQPRVSRRRGRSCGVREAQKRVRRGEVRRSRRDVCRLPRCIQVARCRRTTQSPVGGSRARMTQPPLRRRSTTSRPPFRRHVTPTRRTVSGACAAVGRRFPCTVGEH